MNETFIKTKIKELQNKAKTIGAELKVDSEKLHAERRDVLWYGGEICRLFYKNYTFILDATGDVIVNLESVESPSSSDTDIYDRVADTRNAGEFYDVMSSYIKDDEELKKLENGSTITLPAENPLTGKVVENEYQLVIVNNNWWEVTIFDSNGKFHNPDWICETDTWEEAIEALIDGIKNVTERLNNGEV